MENELLATMTDQSTQKLFREVLQEFAPCQARVDDFLHQLSYSVKCGRVLDFNFLFYAYDMCKISGYDSEK